MTKELQNLKKANKDEKIDSMVKAVDFKLNVLAKARKDLNKLLADDLENLKQVEFEDFNVNFEIVKRVRKLKNTIEDTETKLKDAEEIQNEVVRTLSEKDIDSSADVLGLKA
jgi:tRNA U54 and U55 pseudouridine synthase Pus10